jgi:hypothetical protein
MTMLSQVGLVYITTELLQLSDSDLNKRRDDYRILENAPMIDVGSKVTSVNRSGILFN